MKAITQLDVVQTESAMRHLLISKGTEAFVAALLAQALAGTYAGSGEITMSHFEASDKISIRAVVARHRAHEYMDAYLPLEFCTQLTNYNAVGDGFILEHMLTVRKHSEQETQKLLEFLNFHWFTVTPSINSHSILSDTL